MSGNKIKTTATTYVCATGQAITIPHFVITFDAKRLNKEWKKWKY